MPVKDSPAFVQFHFQHKTLSLKNRNKLKTFILSIFKKEKLALGSVNYIFCSDKYLLGINKEFLNHNYYTDIISFNLANKEAPVEGEVYISLDRVKANALELNQYYYTELHRVILHGALHLCGYNDKTSKEIDLMRKMEEYYLKAYFTPKLNKKKHL
jgi:probable rRNA maturation factor